jgi:alkanesulfonate monooxygenase SsuD/methylene tetrahydromethanopterin reductase-like flavin-dependent oxidoreductase (luciferase family)
VSVSVDVLVADTAAEAAELLLPEAWAMAQARTTGAFPALEPVAGIRAQDWTARQRQYVEQTTAGAIAGTAAQVDSRLDELFERTGAAELVASSSTFDRAALAASDAALAGLFGRAQSAAGRTPAMASPSRA